MLTLNSTLLFQMSQIPPDKTLGGISIKFDQLILLIILALFVLTLVYINARISDIFGNKVYLAIQAVSTSTSDIPINYLHGSLIFL